MANQRLATLANIETSASKAQLRHTQYGLVAIGEQSRFFAWVRPLSGIRTWALRITGNPRIGGLALTSTAVVRSVGGFFNAFDFYIRISIMRP
jgi:hypothetical protein